jgi:hypothetical protein
MADKNRKVRLALVRAAGKAKIPWTLIEEPEVREDGWVWDVNKMVWYSPDNVLHVAEFEGRPWDGNALEPGTVCEAKTFRLKATAEYPAGNGVALHTIVSYDAKGQKYKTLDEDGNPSEVLDQCLVPVKKV